MAIDVRSSMAGRAGIFFQSILAIEELAKVDPSAAVIVDVQNTLFNNAILRWAHGGAEAAAICPGWRRTSWRATRCRRPGSGSDAFALTTRAVGCGGSLTDYRAEAVDHERGGSGIFLLFANVNPEAGYKGITAFLSGARVSSGFTGRQEGRQARDSGFVDLRIDPG